MLSLGKIVQCAPTVGAKIWCLYVCFNGFFLSRSEAGALFVRGVYFEQVLCRCLLVDFDAVFSIFFRDCPFRWAR